LLGFQDSAFLAQLLSGQTASTPARRALIQAAKEGDTTKVATLLKAGTDPS
jgi:hypothetical protein